MTRWMMTGILPLKGTTVELFVPVGMDFRPTHIRTNVTKENVVKIDAIYCGDNPHNQLIHSVDGYYWSAEVWDRMRQDFMKRHGLLGKTPAQIDDYLDENNLSMPDNGTILLPTIPRGKSIRLEGKFDELAGIIILGVAA